MKNTGDALNKRKRVIVSSSYHRWKYYPGEFVFCFCFLFNFRLARRMRPAHCSAARRMAFSSPMTRFVTRSSQKRNHSFKFPTASSPLVPASQSKSERERERKKEKRRGLKWPGAKWLFSVVSIDFGAPVGLATAAGR